MGSFQLTSNAAEVAHGFHEAANMLRELEPVNQAAGAVVAAAPAPHRRGLLGATVHADATANGVTIAGGTSYWTYVHWGAPAIHVKAQPWLLNQLHAHQADIIDLYRTHASDSLDHVGD